MAKKKYTAKVDSYGIYTKWDRESSDLPRIKNFTETIPAIIDIEFGMLLIIKKGKGKKVDFCIDHPPFLNDSGEIAPPFDGEVWINSNDYKFYIGDTIWEPIDDKIGIWEITVSIDGNEIARKKFTVVTATDDDLKISF